MLKIWLGIIFDYLFKFGTPLGVAYWKFAVYKEGVGGSIWYFILGIVFISFYVTMARSIKKQKASRTKTVFKAFLNSMTGLALYFIVYYIGANFTELVWVVLAWIGGYFIGSVIEFFVIGIDKEYIQGLEVI